LIPDIILKDITDKYIRENFFRIQKFFQGYPFFRGEFVHFDLSFKGPVTKQKVLHGLGFKPTDIITTRALGPGALVWEYADFDDKNLVVTTSDTCQVRAFVGAYREEK
jgi:hypothetical protein